MIFPPAERYLVLAGLLLIMLMAHALMQPYESKRDNQTQTLLLAVCGRAALHTPPEPTPTPTQQLRLRKRQQRSR